jgi:tripartite-type tricarboxylate transporter receptor subunit TctC
MLGLAANKTEARNQNSTTIRKSMTLLTELLTNRANYIFSNVTEFGKYIRSAQLNCSFYL